MKAIYDILAAIILAALGQIFWKLGMGKIGSIDSYGFDSILKLLKNAYVDLGIFLYAASTIFWLVALSKKDLSYVYPFIAGTYILVLLASHFMLGEKFGAYKFIGAAIVLLGLLIIFKEG